MIRWLKAHFDAARAYVRRKLGEGLKLLEDLADNAAKYGGEFIAIIERVGPEIEAKIVEVGKLFPDLANEEKLKKVIGWVRDHHGELTSHIPQLKTWIAAVCSLRKAYLVLSGGAK